jgi:hypothetical protein
MDYSFLVGVHFCDDISASKMGSSTFTASPSKLGLFDLDLDKVPVLTIVMILNQSF